MEFTDFSNNSKTYLSEIQDKIASDYFEFQTYQKSTIETLNVFHQICDKNGITYYLAYGSLLGAVRDQGQIPWDYDIDVWVNYSDAEKLMKVLDAQLPSDYYYICRLKNKNCYHYHLRIAPKGYSTEVLHVDVFWLASASNNESLNNRRLNKCMYYNRKSTLRNLELKYFGVTRKAELFKMRYRKIMAKFIPQFVIDQSIEKRFNEINSDSAYLTDNAHFTNLRKEWFESRILVEWVNGMKFYIPNGYLEILKVRYGNMDYANIETRFAEMNASLRRIRMLK